MADFPDSIFNQRELLNRNGIVFDSTKKTTFFADDATALGDEITAIENYFLNTPPITADLLIYPLFGGDPAYLGEDAFCKIRWSRERNRVYYDIWIVSGDDPLFPVGPLAIVFPTEMPPLAPFGENASVPGGLTMLTNLTQEFQYTGMTVTQDLGGGASAIFVAFPDLGIGLDSIWADGNPIELDQQFNLAASGSYFAAFEEE